MGEMADWTLEQWESDDHYFDNVMYLEESDSFIGPGYGRGAKRPTCKYCGKKNLRWHKLKELWLLYEGKGPHRCPKCPLPLGVLKALAEEGKLAYKLKKLKKTKNAGKSK
jgi:hypothetical protein